MKCYFWIPPLNTTFNTCVCNCVCRALSMPRPVQFADLVDKLTSMYQMTLNLFFTQCNGEVRTL